MEYKTLGDTGLLVSKLCFGAMTFHGGTGLFKMVGNTNQKEADEIIKSCVDQGNPAGSSHDSLGRSGGTARSGWWQILRRLPCGRDWPA